MAKSTPRGNDGGPSNGVEQPDNARNGRKDRNGQQKHRASGEPFGDGEEAGPYPEPQEKEADTQRLQRPICTKIGQNLAKGCLCDSIDAASLPRPNHTSNPENRFSA